MKNEEEMALLLGQLTEKILTELWKTLEPHCHDKAAQSELFSVLMATTMISEAMILRLSESGLESELINTALIKAKNHVEDINFNVNGLFTLKGEEV